jgi:ACS family hexuronate transporter-like MFS transporter
MLGHFKYEMSQARWLRMQINEKDITITNPADRSVHWNLLLLLLFAVILGSYQRGEMSILLMMIREEFKLSVIDFGYVLTSFGLASTLGFLLMAVFIWREKYWVGFAVLGILGVLGALLTGVSSGVGGLIVARGISGLACGGLLVGAYRVVCGWLPPESHGLASGLLFAATHSMKLLTPLITMGAIQVGWRRYSLGVAGVSLVWVFLWIWMLRMSRDTFRREQPTDTVTLAQMFKDRVTWIVVVGVALASPLLAFASGRLLSYELELSKAGGATAAWKFVLVDLLPEMGVVAAGFISDTLIRKGWSAGKSRAVLVAICGLLMSFSSLLYFSPIRVFYPVFAMLSVAAGQSMFAVLYAALADAVPGRGIILGIGLSVWLSALMASVTNIMSESLTSRFGSGPLVIGFCVLTLVAIICVRPLARKMSGEMTPA